MSSALSRRSRALGVAERAADGDRPVVSEVRPPERAYLAAAHACGQGELDREAKGSLQGVPGDPQHPCAVLAGERVDGRLHALGRFAEAAGVLDDEVLGNGEIERLLEQSEGL